MTLHGRVNKGVVVLDDPKALPHGTEVIVRPVTGKPPKRRRPPEVAKGLLKLSGKANGLPRTRPETSIIIFTVIPR